MASDAASAVSELGRRGERFDVVFADPTYRDGGLAKGDLSGVALLLSPDGVLVVQTDSEEKPPSLEGFAPFSSRGYGRNVFHFLRIL